MEKIEGARIFLRPISLSDVSEKYLGWLNDPETNKFLETRFNPQRLEDIRKFVESKIGNSTERLFAICLKDGSEHIGNIKLGRIKVHHRVGEISFFIGERKYWGKGFASEAISILTAHAFRKWNFRKIKGGVYAANAGSIRAFEKCGYLLEGRSKDEVLCGNESMDLLQFGITAADFFRAFGGTSSPDSAQN